MNNFVVTIATTRQVSQASVLVKWFSQKKKKKVVVPCPKIVLEYNKFMSGTDLQDQNLNKYRIYLREKKWNRSIFTCLIDVSIQNASILHTKADGKLR